VNWNQTTSSEGLFSATRILGVSRVTIWKKIKKFSIDLSADLRD